MYVCMYVYIYMYVCMYIYTYMPSYTLSALKVCKNVTQLVQRLGRAAVAVVLRGMAARCRGAGGGDVAVQLAPGDVLPSLLLLTVL